MAKPILAVLLLVMLDCIRGIANPALDPGPPIPAPARLRFEVSIDPSSAKGPLEGRLFVVLGAPSSGEPRHEIGATGMKAAPVLARDVTAFGGSAVAVLDHSSALFPLRTLGELAPGDYQVQAVLATNRDLLLVDAPGNLFSKPVQLHLEPGQRKPVRLKLDQRVPDETLPPDGDLTRFIKFRSEVLSRFWGRPMYLRAGIILPAGWDSEPTRRYPLLVRIGGFGTRYDTVTKMMKDESAFRTNWLAADTKRFVVLQVDGAGPLGDPYQVDSANHGPYGTALVEELIPHVEAAYRCIGQPHARFTAGGSTGGWVSLALQVFYPDYFGGCWSGFPDPLDFRAVQLVNLYEDRNAFVNGDGFERPCARQLNGDTEFTMRHETQEENVIGRGDRYTLSGGQWGSWNATYSQRGKDGLPLPIWDSRTGVIDKTVAEHWRQFDLRQILADHWPELGPKLHGKIHVWVGDADNYFLDGGVRLFDDFLKSAQPPADAVIEFAAQKRHGWQPRTFVERLAEMQAAVDANAQKKVQAGTDYLRARYGHSVNCPLCKVSR